MIETALQIYLPILGMVVAVLVYCPILLVAVALNKASLGLLWLCDRLHDLIDWMVNV